MGLAKGQGTLLQLSISSVFTTVANRVEIEPPEGERGSITKTNLDSAVHDSVAGLPKGGDLQLECDWDPAHATHAALYSSYNAGTTEAWKLVFTDVGVADATFSGWIKKFKLGKASTDNHIRISITVELTTVVTITP